MNASDNFRRNLPHTRNRRVQAYGEAAAAAETEGAVFNDASRRPSAS
jgi:hypothetical protein